MSDLSELAQRCDASITRITSGLAPMRVPVDETDPDVVLAECQKVIASLAVAEQAAGVTVEELTEWLDKATEDGLTAMTVACQAALSGIEAIAHNDSLIDMNSQQAALLEAAQARVKELETKTFELAFDLECAMTSAKALTAELATTKAYAKRMTELRDIDAAGEKP